MIRVGRFGAGVLLGGILAGLVLYLGAPDDPEVAASTSTPTTLAEPAPAAAPFLEDGEVLVGSTALLPRGLDVEGGVATFSYDLVGLSPSLFSHEDSGHQGDVLTIPERWALTTGTGAVIEETTGIREHSVRFELPGEDDTVRLIELVGWRAATVFGERIELDVMAGATGVLRSGRATIETVLEQRTSTIVQIDFDRSDTDWGGGVLRPLNQAWRLSGRQGGGIQLIWDGPDAPDRIVLEDAGFAWRPVSGNIVVIEQEEGS